MQYESRRLSREYKTMVRMVSIFCADHHGGKRSTVCHDCQEFLEYAAKRLEKCPYGEDKPSCANCPVHCYKSAQREHARRIMRYSGPRMSYRHPWLAVMHMLDSRRQVAPPRQFKRQQKKRDKT